MLPSKKHQIECLLSLVQGGLNLETAERLVQISSSLAHDSGNEAIIFYTLKNVFADIANALDGEAVDAELFNSLTSETQKDLLNLLEPLRQDAPVETKKLEFLVGNHIARLSIFRAK